MVMGIVLLIDYCVLFAGKKHCILSSFQNLDYIALFSAGSDYT
jgi:hypothetical protein